MNRIPKPTWKLLAIEDAKDGSCYIAETSATSSARIVGFFDGSSGDVFEYRLADDAPTPTEAPAELGEAAVHIIGSLAGDSGQLTVRQEGGSYLRLCRWDRVDSPSPTLKEAKLRTLPQCGCGGSLGSPQLFASFAEMSAFYFCSFFNMA